MSSIKLQASSAAIQFGSATIQSPRKMASIKMQAATMDVALQKKQATNLYGVLRLKQPASQAQIKTAYRSLVKQFHPDTNKSGNDRDFIEIHEAYTTLSDPITRARYDLSLALSLPNGLSRKSDFASYYQTRRWETDQCW